MLNSAKNVFDFVLSIYGKHLSFVVYCSCTKHFCSLLATINFFYLCIYYESHYELFYYSIRQASKVWLPLTGILLAMPCTSMSTHRDRYSNLFSKRICQQNTHFNMYTEISKRQQNSPRKNFHVKCFKTTNFNLTDSIAKHCRGDWRNRACEINTSFKLIF